MFLGIYLDFLQIINRRSLPRKHLVGGRFKIGLWRIRERGWVILLYYCWEWQFWFIRTGGGSQGGYYQFLLGGGRGDFFKGWVNPKGCVSLFRDLDGVRDGF